MFERVYLGEHVREEHERAHEVVRRIFSALADRGEGPEEIVDFIAGMTDRFALEFAEGPL
jgi:dGTP triphosphohydrolase